MTAATDLWEAVKLSYDANGLISLTNIRDGSQTTINETVGDQTALDVINLWPAYAQVAYDSTSGLHVEVGKHACIAMLWRRGGSSSTIAEVAWDEVFSSDGMIARVKFTGPRGRRGPSSNSGVTQKAETINGRRVRGWSDRESFPVGYLPTRRTADGT